MVEFEVLFFKRYLLTGNDGVDLRSITDKEAMVTRLN